MRGTNTFQRLLTCSKFQGLRLCGMVDEPTDRPRRPRPHLADLGPLQVAHVVGEVGQHAEAARHGMHVIEERLRLRRSGSVAPRPRPRGQDFPLEGGRIVEKQPGARCRRLPRRPSCRKGGRRPAPALDAAPTRLTYSAIAKPKVIGTACWPWVRPIWSVSASRRARPIRRVKLLEPGNSTSRAASRNCRARAVSMTSMEVAVRWTKGFASSETAGPDDVDSARTLCRVFSSSRYTSSGVDARGPAPLRRPPAVEQAPRRARAVTSAASTRA